MYRICVFLCWISCTLAAYMTIPAWDGEPTKLYLGDNIKTWTRLRDGQSEEEFIQFCGPTEKNIRCAQFVTAAGKVLEPKTSAKVLSDGTLVINPIAKTDGGSYQSEDEIVKSYVGHGREWKQPKSMIHVAVLDQTSKPYFDQKLE